MDEKRITLDGTIQKANEKLAELLVELNISDDEE